MNLRWSEIILNNLWSKWYRIYPELHSIFTLLIFQNEDPYNWRRERTCTGNKKFPGNWRISRIDGLHFFWGRGIFINLPTSLRDFYTTGQTLNFRHWVNLKSSKNLQTHLKSLFRKWYPTINPLKDSLKMHHMKFRLPLLLFNQNWRCWCSIPI